MEETIVKILRDIETSKAAVAEKFSSHFLKDATEIQLNLAVNFAIVLLAQVSFQMAAKLRPHQEGLKK